MDIPESIQKQNIEKFNNLINDIKTAIIVEKSIRDFAIEYCNVFANNDLILQIYNNKINDIISNIDPLNTDVQNKNLLNLIKTNKINVEMIGYMTPQELCPENWELIIKNKKNKEERLSKIKTTDAYVCKKCHNNKCTTYQAQTRSADEGSTIFITCLLCGHVMKFFN